MLVRCIDNEGCFGGLRLNETYEAEEDPDDSEMYLIKGVGLPSDGWFKSRFVEAEAPIASAKKYVRCVDDFGKLYLTNGHTYEVVEDNPDSDNIRIVVSKENKYEYRRYRFEYVDSPVKVSAVADPNEGMFNRDGPVRPTQEAPADPIVATRVVHKPFDNIIAWR